MSWLDELKGGDKVIVIPRSSSWRPERRVHTVERITPTRQMVLSGKPTTKYKDGDEMGMGTFNASSLMRWSQDEDDKIIATKRSDTVTRYLQSFDYRKLSVEEREEIFRIVSRHGKVEGLLPK